MAVKEGARFRTGIEAGTLGDTTGYGPALTSGTPGTAFGAGTLEIGAKVISTTDGKWYANTGTKAAPTWTNVS